MPRLVRGPTSHAAPSTYALAPNEAFVPESVTATFDGSGAAAAFLPTLSIYAQSGELLARSPATEVAAGSSAEVTFAPLLRAATAAASGGGWQYNIDNTGGWGLLETIGNVGVATSQPNSFTFGDAPSNYSLAINSSEATVFTNDPGSAAHYVVVIEAGGAGALGGNALFVQTDDTTGGGGTTGIQGDVNGSSANTTGIGFGVGASTGTVQGVSIQVDQTSGAATNPAYAVNALATSSGSGDTVGVRCMGHALGAAKACALQCVDHTGAPIFEVRDDGSVHIKTGTAVIADL